MKKLPLLIKYLKPYKTNTVFNIIFNILGIVFSMFSLGMIIPFLNILFKKVPLVNVKPAFHYSVNSLLDYFNYYMSQMIQQNGESKALGMVCIMVVFVFLLKNFFKWLAIYFLSPVRNGISKDVKNDIYTKLISLPLSYFSNERKGEIMARITNDTVEIESSILNILESMIKDPIEIMVYLVSMLWISPRLTLISFIVLPISGLIISLIAKRLKKQGNKSLISFGYLLSIIEESFGGIRIVKSFNAEHYQLQKFKNTNQILCKINTKIVRIRDLSSPISEFLGITAAMIVLYWGGTIVLGTESNLSPSAFIGYMLIFSQMLNPAKALSTTIFTLQKGLAAVERINEIMETPLQITDLPNAISCTEFKQAVAYNNVSFSYQDKKVIDQVSFTIPKGKVVALVGASGSGKSTLADLLPRFYDVPEGSITIDDVNIKDLKTYDIRQLMGIVSQEPILFNDTVANNIAFGNNTATREDIIRAAEIAYAHDFISQLENGYDTMIGERGGKLSGGQRQRITIARAVLKNPAILILDEATSALDTESEKAVQQALYNLMANRTTLVIAHRLSTIQHAHNIIVMHHGKIAEQGTHESLLNQNGIYSKLVAMQSF